MKDTTKKEDTLKIVKRLRDKYNTLNLTCLAQIDLVQKRVFLDALNGATIVQNTLWHDHYRSYEQAIIAIDGIILEESKGLAELSLVKQFLEDEKEKLN